MTRLNWARGRHSGGWSIERSPYRPFSPSDVLRGRVQRKPQAAEDVGPITLAHLVRHGINRVAIWCRACQSAEHRDVTALGPDLHALPLHQLGDAVRCDVCSASTMVSPFKEGALRNA